jgi:coenzyme F420 hydrogenase subunit beta
VFHRFLQEKLDLKEVVKFDIPHHPAHSFDLYTFNGKESIDLEEIRQFINPSCQYCLDMTSQFADISVGSGRAKFRGWNTVIVRTEIGTKIVEMAKKRGMVKTKPIPEESVHHLRRAALNKMKRAVAVIEEKAGFHDDPGYFHIDPRVLERLRDDVDAKQKT